MATVEISLVVPLFNEVDNVRPLYQDICNAICTTDFEFEIIFVDDASTDGTLHVLESLLAHDRRVRVVQLFVNSGQTIALHVGIQRSRGEIVITMDGDLQNDPRDIPLLVSKINAGFDLVTGWRKHREDRLISRKIPSRVANWLIARFLRIPTHDLGCTLKAYRAELVRQIPLYSDMHRFMPAVCAMASTRIDEVIVRHRPRLRGKSKYGVSRIGRVILDALTVKMLLSCARCPLHWFGYWALTSFIVASAIGIIAMIHPMSSEGSHNYVLLGGCIVLTYLGTHLLFSGVFGEIVVHTQRNEVVKALVDVTFLHPRFAKSRSAATLDDDVQDGPKNKNNSEVGLDD